MKTISTLQEFKDLKQDCIISIGNFDGFHIGHAELISNLTAVARKKKIQSCVMTFKPHPHLVIHPKESNFLLSSYERRNSLLASAQIDVLWEIEFDPDFRSLSAREFIQKFLSAKKIKAIYLGHDFALGAGKTDAKEILEQECPGLEIYKAEKITVENTLCSSSKIRRFLDQSHIVKANLFLGRSFILCGEVMSGLGIGQKELVATANLKWDKTLKVPASGVYFTKTKIDDHVFNSITNIGVSPTVVADGDKRIETHLLDYNQQIYSKNISIEFLKFHREEMKFDNKKELLKKIQEDIQKRREYV